jgi:Uma2 family endonuclease
MATATLLTLDQYFDLPDAAGLSYELIDGRVIEMSKPTFGHNAIGMRTGHLLTVVCERSFPDLMVSGDTNFILGPGTVQAPDVVLLRRSVLESAGVYRGALQCAPDLAVEIVSPNESSADLDDKVGNYLNAGTSTVWVIWPRRRHALVYHRDGSVQHVLPGQLLEAPELLPGTGISLDEVFARVVEPK